MVYIDISVIKKVKDEKIYTRGHLNYRATIFSALLITGFVNHDTKTGGDIESNKVSIGQVSNGDLP